MNFSDLGLSEALVRAVTQQGYQEPTPIQQQGIPAVLAGSDVLAAAQTGTGKTAAFTLPLIHKLSDGQTQRGKAPVVLILTPTRELAIQVHANLASYSKGSNIRSTVIYGGVSANPQKKALLQGVDMIVATPGRLLDHHGQRNVDLSKIQTLVLDEADRMLDMGFIHDIKRVMKALPSERQNLLFSATFSKDIRKLSQTILRKPVEINVAPRNAPAELVDQKMVKCAKADKRAVTSWLIGSNNWQQVLVFSRTKHGANRLAKQLTLDGLESAAIHGNKSQGARTRALDGFKKGDIRVLVATDIAARGIDIDQLPHVINFDLPNVAADYVHRIGRTGRAGMSGEAVSLVDREEAPLLRDIERLLNKKIPELELDGFEMPKHQAQPKKEPRHQDPRDPRSPNYKPPKAKQGQANSEDGEAKPKKKRRRRRSKPANQKPTNQKPAINKPQPKDNRSPF